MRMDPAVAATRAAVRDCLAATGLDAGDLVLAAVSGGADSLALAAALAHEGRKAGLRAGCVTVDHGLQTGAADQADRVVEQARALGLEPAVVAAAAVGTLGGPEAAARAARYDALARVARETQASAVVLGHTLDDQAESVLLGLARGSGGRSLAGMRARTDAGAGLRYLRPFLAVRRSTTAAACAALGLQAWDDPHNHDSAFARTRVRSVAMPALEAAIGPGVAEALARTADLLRADADAMDEWAKSVESLATGDLLALPEAVRLRVLRRAALAAGAPAGGVGHVHVREIDRLVTDWHGQGPVALPGGLVAERRCDRLEFR